MTTNAEHRPAMQTPMHTPDESATALGAFFCLVWLVILLCWIVAKSRAVARTVEWFRRKAAPAKILAVAAFTTLAIHAGIKSGGNEPQGMGMRPLAEAAAVATLAQAALPPFALVEARTNGVVLVEASTNAVVSESCLRHGTSEGGEWIEAEAPFFRWGTNVIRRLYASPACLSFGTMRHPFHGDTLPNGTSAESLVVLRMPLGIVPEANWRLIEGTNVTSRFWHDRLSGGGRVFTWENALLDRLADRPATIQAELHRNGDFIYRYDFSESGPPGGRPLPAEYPAATPGVVPSAGHNPVLIGAQRGVAGVEAFRAVGVTTNCAIVYRLDGNPATNGVTVAGLLASAPLLELRWKNVAGLGDLSEDTDNDGLTDWAETFVWGTAPDHADTDGDGRGDGSEIAWGNDPFDADENGDGVPDGISAADWATNPLWAANSMDGANVTIMLNEAIPTGASAVLVLDDLAIPLRTPAFWSFAFVPGTAYDYRLVVSPGTTVNLSITNAVPVQTRRLPLRGEPGEEDTPIWDKGDGGVFDGESDGGKGTVAVPTIQFTPHVNGADTHHSDSGICLHSETSVGFEVCALPADITPHWETENLMEEGDMFILLVPEPGTVYEGTVRLTIDELKVGTLSTSFSAHRCDATEQNPFCSICGCYEPLDADIDLSTTLLTLKHFNKLHFAIKHTNSPNIAYTNQRFEIQQQVPADATWHPMGSSPWTARIAGTFLVRGFATVNGREFKAGQSIVLVRFPTEAQMMADPTVQAHANSLWSQTLALCTETNRHELGCWIKLDTSTDSYTFSDTITGPSAPNNQDSFISLLPVPADSPATATLQNGSAVYVVSSFHTHTPTTYRSGDPRDAGPSPVDVSNSISFETPGIVYDYDETQPGKVRMGLPMNATAILYPTDSCPRRPTPGIDL